MVSTLFTQRHSPYKGKSVGSYSSFNLALHVGDEIEAVESNRFSLSRDVGPSVYMNQVHGNSVVIVDSHLIAQPTADALITQESNVALVVLVADCIPLLLWDNDQSCIAAVHVGRRGLINGITDNVLEIMRIMGARDVQACIGPSICGACYEVGDDVFQEVVDLYPLAQGESHRGARSLDLSKALVAHLLGEGVEVVATGACTQEDKNYFSYRRDGHTGRQAGVIWL